MLAQRLRIPRMAEAVPGEELYLELGRLMAAMPELGSGAVTHEINHWLARVVALLKSNGSLTEAIHVEDSALRTGKTETIADIMHRALTRAEHDAPSSVRGAVIAVGNTLDAYMAVRKVLSTANSDVLLVDPYAGAKVLTDYAVLASDKVAVRLLTNEAEHEASLITAAQRWAQQLGRYRKLTVRLAAGQTLHDRLILVDSAKVWVVGQSFNTLAKRKHTSLIRMRPETARRKIAIYAQIWNDAMPLLTQDRLPLLQRRKH
jgi:hypothetical protein